MKSLNKKIILLIMAAGFSPPNTTFASTVASEGLSRQIAALRTMMKSYKDYSDARIQDLENRENRRTACYNVEKVYWPNHPKADASDCVSHGDIATNTGEFCKEEQVSWQLDEDQKWRTNKPDMGCSGLVPLMKEGEQYTAKDKPPTCNSIHDQRSGSATFKCVNGSFELIEGSNSCIVPGFLQHQCR